MKTTLILNDDLITEAMKIYNVPTKTKAIELALQDAIATHERKTLAQLFGQRKNIKSPPRRKP
jgi:Arc/MetJ family transcription regulator